MLEKNEMHRPVEVLSNVNPDGNYKYSTYQTICSKEPMLALGSQAFSAPLPPSFTYLFWILHQGWRRYAEYGLVAIKTHGPPYKSCIIYKFLLQYWHPFVSLNVKVWKCCRTTKRTWDILFVNPNNVTVSSA